MKPKKLRDKFPEFNGWLLAYWDVTTVAGNMQFPSYFRYPLVVICWDENRWTLNHSLTNDCIKSHTSQYPLLELGRRLQELISPTSCLWKSDWDTVKVEIKPILQGWDIKYHERL